MNDETIKKEIKIPLSVMTDMAKNEIETHVLNCMDANNIPSSLMVSILKDVLLDITQMKVEQLSSEFMESYKSVSQG